MAEPVIPNLSFPELRYGPLQAPWDLQPLLYRGGAGTYIKEVNDLISRGTLGPPLYIRLPLVENLHAHLAGKIAEGVSRMTINTSITTLRRFYAWADQSGRSPSMQTVEEDFISYTEHLLHRVRVIKDIRQPSAHGNATVLSRMFNDVLQLKIGLLTKTRLLRPRSKKRVYTSHADKQNLEQTFAFGHVLLDISDELTTEAIRGALPATIRFRSGQVLEEWCYLAPPHKVKALRVDEPCAGNKRAAIKRRAAWEADTSSRTRSSLINLRVEAEMLIFIAQTGMNLAQAQTLRMGKFRYQSHLDGYRVYRVYKGRRGGEVEFEIYSEYRALFERYLSWREIMFPDDEDGLLFTFVCDHGRARTNVDFQAIRKRCKLLGVKCYRPQKLRRTRANWLLRRSRDPHLTAEMDQHAQETLLRVYDQPHHQVAIAEISRFHAASDPGTAVAMPGPGTCAGATPSTSPSAPSHAPVPDCASPAGCLFCDHQRDIDDDDHVWSLVTYRHFKSLELARYRPTAKHSPPHPAAAAVDRVTAKLKHFESSSQVRALWVREALARIDEADYHPKWDGFIQLLELRA